MGFNMDWDRIEYQRYNSVEGLLLETTRHLLAPIDKHAVNRLKSTLEAYIQLYNEELWFDLSTVVQHLFKESSFYVSFMCLGQRYYVTRYGVISFSFSPGDIYNRVTLNNVKFMYFDEQYSKWKFRKRLRYKYNSASSTVRPFPWWKPIFPFR